nr:MAG TPA: hypothetical protein [Caudoviricetes sp.]
MKNPNKDRYPIPQQHLIHQQIYYLNLYLFYICQNHFLNL